MSFHPTPPHVQVKCGDREGLFCPDSGQVLCRCGEHREAPPVCMTLAAFEKHGGRAAHKKPKTSIKVVATGERAAGSARLLPASAACN